MVIAGARMIVSLLLLGMSYADFINDVFAEAAYSALLLNRRSSPRMGFT